MRKSILGLIVLALLSLSAPSFGQDVGPRADDDRVIGNDAHPITGYAQVPALLPSSNDPGMQHVRSLLERDQEDAVRVELRTIIRAARSPRLQALAYVGLSLVDPRGEVTDLDEARRIDHSWAVPDIVLAWKEDILHHDRETLALVRQALALDPRIAQLLDWEHPNPALVRYTEALVAEATGDSANPEAIVTRWTIVRDLACHSTGIDRTYADRAEEHLRHLHAGLPEACPATDDSWTLFRLAQTHIDVRDFDGAIPLLLAAAVKHPDVHGNAALALRRAGRKEEAYAEARLAVKVASHWSGAHAILAELAAETGRLDEAGREVSIEEGLAPNDPQTHSDLSMLWYLRKDFTRARLEEEEAFRLDAVELTANIATNVSNLAEFDMDEGHLDTAEERLDQVLELAPETSRPYYELALLYDLTGREDASRTMEKYAVEEDAFSNELNEGFSVWPEEDLAGHALAAEARGQLNLARQAWARVQEIEDNGQLQFEALRGRAAAHLAELGTGSPFDAGN